ncbi:unnamed protein product [Caretta caretta]
MSLEEPAPATPKHQAFIARWTILRDTAYGRSHAPAATAQAAATHRRIGNVPATPELDRVSPTTSNASILPEIPTEGNPDSQDRRQADQAAGSKPAPDEVEGPEGQWPMVRAATPWQTAWTEELQAAATFDDFDLLVVCGNRSQEEFEPGECPFCPQNACSEPHHHHQGSQK